MAKKEQTLEQFVNEIQYRDYSISELSNFHQKIQKFYREHTCFNGEVIKVLDMKALQIAFGALSPKGGVILNNLVRDDRDGSVKSYERPTRLEQFDNLWKQYSEWKVDAGLETGTAKFKKLQQLDEMAKQMTIKE